MYFKDFPKFLYDFKYGAENDHSTTISVVTDITRNIRFRKEILENYSLYDEYDIQDGETPEIIAEKIYGNPQYHWIIMLANQKYDYISDFPLDQQSLNAHIIDRYNPVLTSADWHIDRATGRMHIKIDNPEEGAYDPAYLTAGVIFKFEGNTIINDVVTPFSITELWGDFDEGLEYGTQYFWVEPDHGLPAGEATGTLTITTKGRENNPVYFLNADGFKVDPTYPGAYPVSGIQEAERINESKRRIKIISPDVISQILKQYKELM